MITFESIGTVVSEFKKPEDCKMACKEGKDFQAISRIFVKEHLAQGIGGLSKFSHLWIIYHLNKDKQVEIETYPGPIETYQDKVGVFASRSQHRPNHIALRLVKVIGIEDNIIEVQGLDAMDGSPVLDIKPFVKGFDYPDNPITAEWYRWLDGH